MNWFYVLLFLGAMVQGKSEPPPGKEDSLPLILTLVRSIQHREQSLQHLRGSVVSYLYRSEQEAKSIAKVLGKPVEQVSRYGIMGDGL